MKYKNYYKILELKSDRASEEDIKNAYRKLAKQYHPDRHPGDEVASEKFKAVNEAYQVLSDENARRKYDRLHHLYRVKDTIDDTKNKMNKDGLNDMMEMMFGKKEEEVTENHSAKALAVRGENLESQIEITLEEAFLGTEKKLVFKTEEGKRKSISLKIPKGIREGEKVRVTGQGKAGKNGGENGDLLIQICFLRNEKYELIGNDICLNLLVSPWEAAFGTNVSVKTVDASILVNVPAGVQTGEKLRIANNGFWNGQGGRGDLLLNVQIMMPKQLSEGEKLLFKKLAEISEFEPRKK